jgi:hypothetical protein
MMSAMYGTREYIALSGLGLVTLKTHRPYSLC